MEFIDTFEGAVIVSDSDGNIIYLNEKAISNFQTAGGRDLIGKNLKDCHHDFSNEKIREMNCPFESPVCIIFERFMLLLKQSLTREIRT